MAERIVIIGGGASGLAAAVTAAGRGAAVTIIEHKDRVGKKLLVTGNGKCNLTNMSDFHGKYYSSDARGVSRIYETLERFNASDTRAFFRELGLYTKEKRDGGVYPMGEQASTVSDVLRSACMHRGVRILTDCEVRALKPTEHGGRITCGQRMNITYDRLILATGGRAAPATGSDGSGYALARRLGHSVTPVLP
ncbi:MAG: aminoacetone oxidase family FAD-binding enzyme, partial [Roseburia sp.]|nr:aminoacetone oxidase family FAD-binding enzyme [Roseburia sp.]